MEPTISLVNAQKANYIQKLINDIKLNEENMMNQNETALIPQKNEKNRKKAFLVQSKVDKNLF